MATHTVPSDLRVAADPAVETMRAVLAELFGPIEERHFAVELWDGTVEATEGAVPAPLTLVLRRAGALRRMLLPPSELSLA